MQVFYPPHLPFFLLALNKPENARMAVSNYRKDTPVRPDIKYNKHCHKVVVHITTQLKHKTNQSQKLSTLEICQLVQVT